MKGLLLDTNIPSEMTRPHPQPRVSEWLDETLRPWFQGRWSTISSS
jgi:predicted nucleic acid-binding protein